MRLKKTSGKTKDKNFKVSKHQGMTVVEMIVALAVSIILFGMVITTISRYLPSIQLNGSTKLLSANLREAQERAVTEQKQHLIRFFPQNVPPSYQMIRLNGNNEELIRQTNLPSEQILTIDAAISSNQLVFSADGGPSTSGNIILSNSSSNKTINVSPAGFIRVQ